MDILEAAAVEEQTLVLQPVDCMAPVVQVEAEMHQEEMAPQIVEVVVHHHIQQEMVDLVS
jgi:hypothetical protein|tara:strand:+ start:341 stop:520 length:180 start_codon:yes stop_codon:yes gene_type:complete